MAVQLGSVTLDHLTGADVRDRARIVRHSVPAMAGDLVQQLGRSGVDIELTGSFFGPDAVHHLAAIRAAFRGNAPVDLLADAAGDGYVATVVLAGLDVRQRPGDVDRFDYRIELVEYVKPPVAPVLGPLPAVDSGLAAEAAGYLDDVQDGLAQVSAVLSLTRIAGFGNPTTKAPKMLQDYQDAGGGLTDPAEHLRDLF